MGVDLAVTFVDGTLTLADLLATDAVAASPARTLFFVLGAPCRQSAGLSFFATWADGPLDIKSVARQLSRIRGKACVVWKSESGGVGGYESFENGESSESVASADRFWLLPSQGIEKTFGNPLKIRQRDHVCFPEFLIDDRLACHRVTGEPSRRETELQPSGFALQLLSASLGVEPVFPFESLEK